MGDSILPQIRGLFEAHLAVADLDRSVAFYRDTLGLPLALAVPDRHAAFFWVPEAGRGLLGLWAVHSSPIGRRLHVAFTASLDQLLHAPAALRAKGLAPLDFDGRPTSEPVVLAWMPAASLYFHDPDGHLLEYLCMLDGPPRADVGVVPYSAWVAGGTGR